MKITYLTVSLRKNAIMYLTLGKSGLTQSYSLNTTIWKGLLVQT